MTPGAVIAYGSRLILIVSMSEIRRSRGHIDCRLTTVEHDLNTRRLRVNSVRIDPGGFYSRWTTIADPRRSPWER